MSATSTKIQGASRSSHRIVAPKSWGLKLDRQHLPLLTAVVLLVVLYGSGALLYEPFRSTRFWVDLIKGNASVGLCATGMTFVILAGGIDLSVGAVMALVTVIVATLVGAGTPLALALLSGVLSATAFGAVSGALTHFLALPAFLVTLSGMFFARGLAFWVSPLPARIDHPGLEWILDELGFSFSLPGAGSAWMPPTATLFLLVLTLLALVSKYTRVGRYAFAVGGDPKAAELMGVPIGLTRLFVYALSGFCAGLAGLCTVLIDGAGKPNIGVGLELDAIAAVVIGGTLLTGGAGSVVSTLLGVLVIGMVRSVIIFDGRLPSPWQHITVGLLLLGFIAMQRLLTGPKRASPS